MQAGATSWIEIRGTCLTSLFRFVLPRPVVSGQRSCEGSACAKERDLCPMRNVVKQVGRKSMSFLVGFYHFY